jgi:hypothetical protein
MSLAVTGVPDSGTIPLPVEHAKTAVTKIESANSEDLVDAAIKLWEVADQKAQSVRVERSARYNKRPLYVNLVAVVSRSYVPVQSGFRVSLYRGSGLLRLRRRSEAFGWMSDRSHQFCAGCPRNLNELMNRSESDS